jgi:hypothetical protein
LLSISGALVPGCGDDNPAKPDPPTGLVPDFALLDVNPNSPSYSQVVSPRQEQGKVSAWYFGFAT